MVPGVALERLDPERRGARADVARERLALLEDEKRALQANIDAALNETARLTRRLTESENTLTATRAQLGMPEGAPGSGTGVTYELTIPPRFRGA